MQEIEMHSEIVLQQAFHHLSTSQRGSNDEYGDDRGCT